MTDGPATTPAKKVTKKAAPKPKKPATHPKYSEMTQKAISALKERGGSSRQAILKYICKEFNVGSDERTINVHLKMALRAGVKNESLKQSKGTGASGSFRIGEKAKKAPKAKAAAKPAAKKPAAKKPATKKAATPKKKAATKKAATPKKAAAKKPVAKKAKVAKKPASPKKVAAKKPAAKKPVAKKPAAKKPAAKKAAKK